MDLGKVAYECYRVASNGHSLVSGVELPEWNQLDPNIKAAWRATADGLKMFLEARQERIID